MGRGGQSGSARKGVWPVLAGWDGRPVLVSHRRNKAWLDRLE